MRLHWVMWIGCRLVCFPAPFLFSEIKNTSVNQIKRNEDYENLYNLTDLELPGVLSRK